MTTSSSSFSASPRTKKKEKKDDMTKIVATLVVVAMFGLLILALSFSSSTTTALRYGKKTDATQMVTATRNSVVDDFTSRRVSETAGRGTEHVPVQRQLEQLRVQAVGSSSTYPKATKMDPQSPPTTKPRVAGVSVGTTSAGTGKSSSAKAGNYAAASAAATVAEKPPTKFNPTIVNGDDAKEKDYLYFAISSGILGICGASLIHKDILLTAAHCQGSFNAGLFFYDVKDKEYSRLAFIDEQRRHPTYETIPQIFNGDIMVRLVDCFSCFVFEILIYLPLCFWFCFA